MKKRINLFRTKPKRPLSPFMNFLSLRGKKIATVIAIIFFIIFLFINYQIIIKKKAFNQIEKTKEEYLNYLLGNKETEAKFRYFKAKQQQLSDYYGEDAFFLPYYQVLLGALKPASDAAVLESVTINNKRDSTFIVKISNFDKAISFLKYVESDDFLKNFDELVLTSFNLFESRTNTNTTESQKNSYQFSFAGSFKTINESL